MNIDAAISRLAGQGVAFAPEIVRAASGHRLDPELLAAVAAQETGGPASNAGRNVVGDGGHGRGLFQIDDRWHRFAAQPAAMDPGANAQYAAGLLSNLLDRYHGDIREALSAYNTGRPDARGTTTRWPDGKDLGYADSVLRHYQRLTGAPAPTAASEMDSPAESATAELTSLIASLRALPLQAGCLPNPPAPAPLDHPQPYRRQATDYAELLDS